MSDEQINYSESINGKVTRKDISQVFNRVKKGLSNKNPRSFYEIYKGHEEMVKIHFDVDYPVEIKNDERDIKELEEEITDILIAKLGSDLEFISCSDDKTYRKKNHKEWSRKFSIHIVCTNRMISTKKLLCIIPYLNQDVKNDDFDFEFDESIYRNAKIKKFRLPLTNKDKSMEERKKPKKYLSINGRSSLENFKKLCITYTKDCEEYKNEIYESLYQQEMEKKNNDLKLKKEIGHENYDVFSDTNDKETIQLVLDGFEKDHFSSCDQWIKLVFILKNADYPVEEAFQIINDTYSTDKYRNEEGFKEIEKAYDNDDIDDDNKISLGTLIYQLKEHNPKYYETHIRSKNTNNIYKSIVDRKIKEFKARNPRADILSFNDKLLHSLTTIENDYQIKVEYFSRFVKLLNFDNKFLYKELDYDNNTYEWKEKDKVKMSLEQLTYNKLVEVDDFTKKEKKYRDCKIITKTNNDDKEIGYFVYEEQFIKRFNMDKEIQRYNGVSFHPYGIDENMVEMNNFNTFTGFGFETTNNIYVTMFGDFLVNYIDLEWITRKQWNDNTPHNDLMRLIKHLSPVENFIKDIVTFNLKDQSMNHLHSKTKKGILTIPKDELYRIFLTHLNSNSNDTKKTYKKDDFEKNIENILFGKILKSGRKNFTIDLKLMCDKINKLKIVDENINPNKFIITFMKDYPKNEDGEEEEINEEEEKKEKERLEKEKKINLIIKNKNKKSYKDFIEKIKNTENFNYDEEIITDLKLYLEYLFIYMCRYDFDSFMFFLKWLKFLIVYPRLKNGMCMIFFSKEKSVGKGKLSSFLRKLVGNDISLFGDIDKLSGQFSNTSDKTILNIYDEIGLASFNNKTYNKFKNKITEVDCEVEKKNVNVRKGKDYNKFILLTNELQCIKVDGDETRFFVYHFKKEYNEKTYTKYEGVIKKFSD